MRKDNQEATKYLLNRINPIIANTHGMNIIHYATELESLPLLNILLGEGTPWLEHAYKALDTGTKEDCLLPLHIAVIKGNKCVFKYLIQIITSRKRFMSVKEMLEYKTKYSMTAFLVAVQYNRFKMFKYLIELGSDIYAKNARMQNALHLAAINGNKDMIEMLMGIDREEGRLLYSKDYRGKTPIEYAKGEDLKCALISIWNAIDKSNLITIKKLMEYNKGETLKLKHSKDGNTPLHYAVKQKKKAVVRLLMEYNIDKNIANIEKKTAEDLAKEIEDEKTRKAILDALNAEVKEQVMLKSLLRIKGRRMSKSTIELIKDTLELSEKEALNMMNTAS